MAVKTFSVGEVLTASDTNTYLANAGLVYVTSTTVGSGVTSVTVSNCFSSTYDAYKIVVTGGSAAGNGTLTLQLSGITTGYGIGIIYWAFTAGAGVPNIFSAANQANWQEVGSASTNGVSMNVEITNPFLAKHKVYGTATPSMFSGGSAVWTTGNCLSTSSATGFVITSSSALTGCLITVYGYRKA